MRSREESWARDRLIPVSDREAHLDEARTAYGRNDWTAARSLLLAADAPEPLAADDLERLAWSCRWASDQMGFLNALERAEVAFSAAGARAAAARMALEQARQHMQMLDESVAVTCFLRGMELLEGEAESSEHALAMWMLSFTQLAEGDVDGARASLQEAWAIARRVVSPGMEAMAVQGLAHIAVTEGDRAEVLPLVDEAAALAMRPGVEPIHAGFVYSAVISICRALCDWGRATEWTNMSTRYCERESIAGYSGLCRFHQGEIERLHGQLAHAEERVLRACEELRAVNRYSAAWGYSELVDIRVRRGDLAGAEEALAQAVAFGDDGQPGRGRLLLAQGDAPAAVRSLSRALADRGMLAQSGGCSCSRCTCEHARGGRRARGERQRHRARGAREPAGDARAGGRSCSGTRRAGAAPRRHRGRHRLPQGGRPHLVRGRRSVRSCRGTGAARSRADRRRRRRRGPPRDQGRGTNRGGDRRRRRPRHHAAETQPATRALRTFSSPTSWTRRGSPRRWVRTPGAAAALARPHPARGVRAMAGRGGEARRRWLLRGLRSARRRHRLRSRDPAGARAPPRRSRLRAHGPHRASRRRGHHRDDDYFGAAVTRAARISAAAGGGEVLASADLLASCERTVPVAGERTLELKGIAEPMTAVLIAWRDESRVEPSAP